MTGNVLGILLGWIAATVAVVGVVTRPWTSAAARAPLPLALAGGMAVWTLSFGTLTYGALVEKGSWTAATLTIAIVPVRAILLTLLAYALGRTILTARTSSAPPIQRWGPAIALTLFTLYFPASDLWARHRAVLVRHATSAALSTTDVDTLAQRVRAGRAVAEEQGAFLGNPLCPPELLAAFAPSTDPRWRRAVARNPALSPALAETLLQDTDEQVRYMLAFNRELPAPLLARLAADTSEHVRGIVAMTPNLPDEALAKLVADPSPHVRAAVTLAPHLSSEALERLRSDSEERVRDAANRRPDP